MPRQLSKRDDLEDQQRWVDDNFNIKHELKQMNHGIMPSVPAFSTSEFPGSDQCSEENPPDILFFLKPPQPKLELRGFHPQPIYDDEGHVMISPHKKNSELRLITTLPDVISADVPGWLIMVWRRTDPRITLQDIVDRMTTDLGDYNGRTTQNVTLPSKNILQNRCGRQCRKLLNYCHDFDSPEPPRAEVEAISALTTNNITYNTTLNIHPEYNRLIKVKFIRKTEQGSVAVKPMNVTPENFLQTTLPINHFVFLGYTPELSPSMIKSTNVLYTLQERAIKHGYNGDQWRKLDRTCLPASWYGRTSTKTASNDTFNGGCHICTWKSGETEEHSSEEDAMDEDHEQENDDEDTMSDSHTMPDTTPATTRSGVYNESMSSPLAVVSPSPNGGLQSSFVFHQPAIPNQMGAIAPVPTSASSNLDFSGPQMVTKTVFGPLGDDPDYLDFVDTAASAEHATVEPAGVG